MQFERLPGIGSARKDGLLQWIQQGALRQAVRHLFWALAYFIGAKVGFALTLQPQPIAMLWPPNAIFLAALLLTPRTQWWWLAVAIFFAHLSIELGERVPFAMVLCWFFTNLSEALIAAVFLKYTVAAPPNFHKIRDVGLFLIGAVCLAPFVSSFLDVSLVKLVGWGRGSFWELWNVRFFSNVLAMLVIVPVILTTAENPSLELSASSIWHRIEAFVLAGLLLVHCLLVFAFSGFERPVLRILLFDFLPLMLWAATRFGARYVSYLLLILALFVTWNAQHSQRLLFSRSVSDNALGLQLFLILAAIPVLLLTAVISEWRRTEQSVIDKTRQLQMALRAGNVDAWSWDLDSHQFSWSSGSAEGIAEYDGKVELPEAFRNLHPNDRQRFAETLHGAVSSGKSYEIELRVLEPAFGYRWVVSRGSPQFDADGKVHRLLGVNTDISKRKQEADQIRQQRNELAHLSRVAMLGEMSGAIAHELNQPLTAILSNTQAARRMLQRIMPEIGVFAEILDDVISESKRASEIIQRMRDLLKKGEVKMQTLDINAIVPKVVLLEHSDLIGRNIAVTTDLQTDLLPVCADPVQMQQVLLNLMTNACDAMRDSATSDRLIRIATRNASSEAVHIEISDRGDGVPVEKLETIFEPFYSTKQHGLGLGLTICRSIVLAHGGDMWVSNNPEGGATFHLSLPVANDRAA